MASQSNDIEVPPPTYPPPQQTSGEQHDNAEPKHHHTILPAIFKPKGDEYGRRMENPFKGIKKEGESGRSGIHPWHFLRICFRSTCTASLLCNFLWPLVPVALAVRYTLPERSTLIFTLAYLAMVPCANLIGFSGQELARKLPHVFGVLMEITAGSVVEIVLFMVLLSHDEFYVVKAAILGSMLATLLLCLGACFFVGGLTRHDQHFSEVVSETGSGLLLTAGVVLALPAIFDRGISSMALEGVTTSQLELDSLHISRIISILLMVSYVVYTFFQVRSHHGIYDAIFEHDEEHDHDREKDLAKEKLTLVECIFALVIAVALVTIIAITLVREIKPIIEQGRISDSFMGLILVPLVEKFAEHITAIDEAHDNQMNLALSHVIGATLQTALFNAPLTVIVAWGLPSSKPMDLNFDIFTLVMLLLAIFTVGRFLQDQKSNYLEGFLCVILYIAIAVAAYYSPLTPELVGEPGALGGEGGGPAERAMYRRY